MSDLVACSAAEKQVGVMFAADKLCDGSFATTGGLEIERGEGRPTSTGSSVPTSAPGSPIWGEAGSDPAGQSLDQKRRVTLDDVHRCGSDDDDSNTDIIAANSRTADDFDAEVAAINRHGSPVNCGAHGSEVRGGGPAPGSIQDVGRRVASMIQCAHGSVDGTVTCAEVLTFVQALLEACAEDGKQVDAEAEAKSLCAELGDGSGVMAAVLRDMLCETFEDDEKSLEKFEAAFHKRRATLQQS